jgi:hypothetical protein
VADIESGPWPLAAGASIAVVCTNYLWRPLLPTLIDAVGDDGVLLYETFAVGNETVGKPSNPAFLLRPASFSRGRRVARDRLRDGFIEAPARFVQRVVAVRDGPSTEPPRRWPLPGSDRPAAAERPARPAKISGYTGMT